MKIGKFCELCGARGKLIEFTSPPRKVKYLICKNCKEEIEKW